MKNKFTIRDFLMTLAVAAIVYTILWALNV